MGLQTSLMVDPYQIIKTVIFYKCCLCIDARIFFRSGCEFNEINTMFARIC